MKLWSVLLVCLVSLDLLLNVTRLHRFLRVLFDMRHNVMIDPRKARAKFCANPERIKLILYFREDGDWVNSCESESRTGELPRFWRIELTFIYEVLFLTELPITFPIDIKR